MIHVYVLDISSSRQKCFCSTGGIVQYLLSLPHHIQKYLILEFKGTMCQKCQLLHTHKGSPCHMMHTDIHIEEGERDMLKRGGKYNEEGRKTN